MAYFRKLKSNIERAIKQVSMNKDVAISDRRPTRKRHKHIVVSQWFLGSGENDYLFLGSWGALVII